MSKANRGQKSTHCRPSNRGDSTWLTSLFTRRLTVTKCTLALLLWTRTGRNLEAFSELLDWKHFSLSQRNLRLQRKSNTRWRQFHCCRQRGTITEEGWRLLMSEADVQQAWHSEGQRAASRVGFLFFIFLFYLVERRADSINPLQLQTWKLILPVTVKDGLKGKKRKERESKSCLLLWFSCSYRPWMLLLALSSQELLLSALKSAEFISRPFSPLPHSCSPSLRGSAESALQR